MEDTKKKSSFDVKQYMKNYYQTHKDNYFKKIVCDVCNHEYISANRYHHMKSKKHLYGIQLNELTNLRLQIYLYKFLSKNIIIIIFLNVFDDFF